MTELSEKNRELLMRAVFLVEQVQRAVLAPTKINLASLGNMTPHLHWHIIPRWVDDATFPQPIWATADEKRSNSITTPVNSLPAYVTALRSRLNASE